MNKDLVSSNFTSNINHGMIRHNMGLVRILLILICIYGLFNIVVWYYWRIYLPDAISIKSDFGFYRTIIWPVIQLIETVLAIIAWNLHLKANKLILTSFENEDSTLFNKGYSFTCRAMTYIVIYFGIVILSEGFFYYLLLNI